MQRKVHFHGYTLERAANGVYVVLDEEGQRVDKGAGFNSVVEAQIYIIRRESKLLYFENDFRTALEVSQAMIDNYLEKRPEHAAYFSVLAPGRFAEAIAEEIARLRALRTGEDLDLED